MKCIGFSDKTLKWFPSYLTNKVIFVSLGTVFLQSGTLNCGVPQGSILGSLLLLLCINDIRQALSNGHTYLYADDTSIFCQHKLRKLKMFWIKNLCDWFVDNKLTVHFGKDKPKSILFSRDKNLPKLNPLSANPTKWSNTLKQFVCKLLTNFLSVLVHFEEFGAKRINITYNNNRIKQYRMVEYLGCCLHANLVESQWQWNLFGRSIQSYNSYVDRMSF